MHGRFYTLAKILLPAALISLSPGCSRVNSENGNRPAENGVANYSIYIIDQTKNETLLGTIDLSDHGSYDGIYEEREYFFYLNPGRVNAQGYARHQVDINYLELGFTVHTGELTTYAFFLNREPEGGDWTGEVDIIFHGVDGKLHQDCRFELATLSVGNG